jgi:hypothetical protein
MGIRGDMKAREGKQSGGSERRRRGERQKGSTFFMLVS